MADHRTLGKAETLYKTANDLQEEIDREAGAMARALGDGHKALVSLDALRLALLQHADCLRAASSEGRVWENKAMEILRDTSRLEQKVADVSGSIDTAPPALLELGSNEVDWPVSPVPEEPRLEDAVAVERQPTLSRQEATIWWDRFAESEQLFEEQLQEAQSLVGEAGETAAQAAQKQPSRPAEKKREQTKTQ